MQKARNGSGAQRGFTLIELLFTLAVIFLIMGLLLGGIRHIMRQVKGTADLATVNALKNGVSQFAQTVGFVPPLVMDLGPPNQNFTLGPILPATGNAPARVRVFTVTNDATFLRTSPVAGTTPLGDMRFSMYTLPYYLMGVLDVPRGGSGSGAQSPIDGLPGPGTRMPKRDGTWEFAGRTFSPFFDPKGHAEAIVTTDSVNGKIELRDSRGVAFRYYRWMRGNANNGGQVTTERDLNIPWILGTSPMDQDPARPAAVPWTIREELKNADYAILAAGPDGLIGDEFLLPPGHPQLLTRTAFDLRLGGKAPATDVERAERAMADNIVVAGTEPGR